MTKRQFLIVTNDFDIGQSIQDHYKNDPMTEAYCAGSLSQALTRVIKGEYCLLMVDLQLSSVDKAEMIRIFRITKNIPILALTEILGADEKITLFQAGVNAFLEKPIDAGVCSAQANALVELHLKSDDEQDIKVPLTVGTTMMIAPRYHRVYVDGTQLELTRKEFDLLYFFAKHPGQVFSRNQLYEQVWNGFYELGGEETVKSYIKTLRKKLSLLDTNMIENVWGVGYRFVPLNQKEKDAVSGSSSQNGVISL